MLDTVAMPRPIEDETATTGQTGPAPLPWSESSPLDNRGYAPLELASVRSCLTMMPELYLKEDGQYALFRDEAAAFSEEDRDRLLATGVSRLWVPMTREGVSHQNLSLFLGLPDEVVRPHMKSALVYSTTSNLAQRLLMGPRGPLSEEEKREAERQVSLIVGYLASSSDAFAVLLSVMDRAFSTYLHTVNVVLYTLGLAQFIGISNRQDLEEMGLGALLHDVGKIKVPDDLLNKPGPLSPREWGIIRQHPIWGVEALTAEEPKQGRRRGTKCPKTPELPEVAVKVVLQHHERSDGSGYPAGLTGKAMHPFAVLVALCDVYDALTSRRPFRQPLTSFQALSLMKKHFEGPAEREVWLRMVRFLGEISRPLDEPAAARALAG